jgi:hypothetical protein
MDTKSWSNRLVLFAKFLRDERIESCFQELVFGKAFYCNQHNMDSAEDGGRLEN